MIRFFVVREYLTAAITRRGSSTWSLALLDVTHGSNGTRIIASARLVSEDSDSPHFVSSTTENRVDESQENQKQHIVAVPRILQRGLQRARNVQQVGFKAIHSRIVQSRNGTEYDLECGRRPNRTTIMLIIYEGYKSAGCFVLKYLGNTGRLSGNSISDSLSDNQAIGIVGSGF